MHTGTEPTISQIRAELRQIISDVIGADLADVDDEAPLLDYVTSSLALLQGIRKVYDRFGVLIPIRPLLEGAENLRALSAFIDDALKAHDKNARVALARAADTREQGPRIALTPSQRHIGFLARYSGGASSAYNEALVLRLRGPLHGPALQTAIEAMGERHEALRAALSYDSDAIILDPDRLELPISHCAENELSARLAGLAGRPFEAGERLFRAELLRLAERDHVLALVGHALVVDHEALMTVVEDIAEFYGVFARGDAARDMRPAVQLTEYMARHDAEATKPARAAAEAYWQEAFSDGVAALEWAGRRRPAVKSYDGSRLAVAVPPDMAASLQAWPGLSASTVLFGAFTAVLHRLAGQSDIVVGARSAPMYVNGEQRVICTTRTMLPVRSHYDAGRRFADHVRSAAAVLAEADAHRQLSLGQIIRLLKVARDQSRPALFSAAFRTQAYDALPKFQSLRCALVPVAITRARYDIELILASTPDGMELWCDYCTELFEAETISRWLQGLIEFVRSGLADNERQCGLLPIMPDHDRRLLLHDWSGDRRSYPRERTTLDLVTDRARTRGDHVAIRRNGEELTYARLGARIDEIARELHGNAIRRGDRVAVLLRRTLDLIPAMLAAWRVGAAYVPLDPAMPKKRIAFMLDDAEVRAIVTTRDLVHLVEGQPRARPICLDDPCEQIISAPPEILAASGTDSAYVMYTSGSTGQPNGVEITHSALVNCLLAVQDVLEFSQSSSLLAISTPSFDISTVELFMPLIAGGTVQLGEQGLVADGMRLAERIEAWKPSHVQATASTWKVVLAAGWGGDRALCIVNTGEALGRDLAEQLLPRVRTLWNLYGPTETTVYTTAYQVTSKPDEPMRIGRPLPNTQAYILDEQRQPVPIGVVGELYIGGDGLARGYVRRSELTQDRFIANPFRPGERMYRTGDLARYLSTRDIVCLGRVDHQTKIRGYRVELGEVETALRAAGADDAVVTTWVDANGDKQLVAHVLAKGGGASSAADLRERLRDALPGPMIPLHIMFTDAFPLMASGKVDRAALPSPDLPKSANGGAEAPATPTERLVVDAWAKVLGIGAARISRDDDFIDLGGHSLLMTPLMVAVRRLFDVTFNMRDFFGASTVRKFAALIDDLRRSVGRQAADYQPTHARDSEWARQRMAFLRREADLPSHIAPGRGLVFQPQRTRALLLTGATGFLGAYLVAEILRTTDARLYCLVRPKQGAAEKARIETQLRQYQLWDDDEQWRSAWEARLHVVSGDVILPRLGLADAAYEALGREIDCIIHSAAHVNFIYPYEALKGTNVLGLHEIIRFAFHARIKPVHYLSTAAIWPMGSEHTFHETDSLDHGKLLNLGYDEAKWVGERCLVNAAERGLPVARYRPGEVSGDSVTGRCALNHFLIAAFKGFLQCGAFPVIDTHVDVAPVDYVAKAIVHMVFRGNPLGRAFHLTNPQSCHMKEALTFLRNAGYRFEELSFEEVRSRLVESAEFADNALFTYQATLESMDARSFELPKYDCKHTQRELAGSGIVCPPVDDRLFETYLRYLRNINFLPEPSELAGQERRSDRSTGHTRIAPTHHATA